MKKIMIPILMVLALGLVGLVSAAFTCTVVTPASSARLNGNALFNITVAGTNNNTVRNCSVTATSSLTGDSWTVGTAYNYSVNDAANPYLNVTASSYEGSDGTDWAVAATCNNGTVTAQACTGTTGIDIDNGVPVFSSASPATGTTSGEAVSFSIVGSNATSATIYIDGESFAMSESSDTFTYSQTLDDGTRDWYVIASDGTNSTKSDTYRLQIELDGRGGAVPVSVLNQAVQQQKTANTLAITGTSTKVQNNVKAWFENEMKPWELTKTIGLAVILFVVGSIIPGIGNILGAVIGAIIGLIL